MITKQEVEALLYQKLWDGPIVSFYLNLEEAGVTPPQFRERADGLLQNARHAISIYASSDRVRETKARAVTLDIERINAYLQEDFDPAGLRGLAIFASGASGLWKVVPLACPVTDGIVLQEQVYIRPLLQAMDDAPRCAITLVDREMGRFFLVDQNEVLEFHEVKDKVPGRIHARSRGGVTDKHVERHIDEKIHRHLHHMADMLEVIVQSQGVERVLIGGPPDVLAGFECLLPPTVRERLKGHIPNPLFPTLDVVLESARTVIHQTDNAEKKQLVEFAIQESAGEGLAVLGLEATLTTLYLKAARTLLLERDHARVPGFACQTCGRLCHAVVGHSCPSCGAPDIKAVTDLIEEAVKAALAENAEIRFVEGGLVPEWDQNLEGVAALLRFIPASPQSP